MLNYKEMPKGVIQIHIIQIFCLFGFVTLMGLLNFYLSNLAGFTKTQANTITSSFLPLTSYFTFLVVLSVGVTLVSEDFLALA